MIYFIISVLLFAAALTFLFQSRSKWSLISILLLAFVLRMFVIQDPMLHPWDERYHALVAKNMAEDPFYPVLYADPVLPYAEEDWTGNHIWVHKQPLPLWAIATSIKVFGAKAWAVRVPSMLLGVLGVFLTFLIASKLFDDRVGLVAALLHAINGFLIEQAGGRVPTDHIDAFHLFFVEAAIASVVLFADKRKMVWLLTGGVMMGLAILCKWLTALIALPFLWALFWNKEQPFKILKLSLIMLVPAVLVALPWQLYIYGAFPAQAAIESASNWNHITHVLDGMEGGPFFHIDKVRILYGEYIYISILGFLLLTYRPRFEGKYLSIMVWFLIPLIFFSIVATKMRGYTSFASPALFIMTAALALELWREWKSRYRIPLIVLGIVCLALNVRFSLERVKFFDEKAEMHEQRTAIEELKKIGMQEGTVVFNNPYPIESMFFNGGTAYAYCPEDEWNVRNDLEVISLISSDGSSCNLPGMQVASPF
jgi:4-amino-4-deoxy-L-arabinose transferase